VKGIRTGQGVKSVVGSGWGEESKSGEARPSNKYEGRY